MRQVFRSLLFVCWWGGMVGEVRAVAQLHFFATGIAAITSAYFVNYVVKRGQYSKLKQSKAYQAAPIMCAESTTVVHDQKEEPITAVSYTPDDAGPQECIDPTGIELALKSMNWS